MHAFGVRLALLGALAVAPLANAFKVDSHLWIADQILSELQNTPAGQPAPLRIGTAADGRPIVAEVPAYVRDAIVEHPNVFLVSVMGADLYPDMVVGQMTTHPGLPFHYDHQAGSADQDEVAQLLNALGLPLLYPDEPGWQTDDWLKHVRDAALAKSGTNPSPELAFALGYLLHAAMDTWAHSYVNSYSGDVFSIGSNRQSAARHVVLESFMAHGHEKFRMLEGLGYAGQQSQRDAARELGRAMGDPRRLRAQGTDQLSSLQAPAEFVRRTLILNNEAAAQYAREPAAYHAWAMWFWWNQSQRIGQDIRQARSAIDAQLELAEQAVLDYRPLWTAAETAKNTAAVAADNALATLDTARQNLLGAIAGNPPLQQALDKASGALEQILDLLPPGPLRDLGNAYRSAATTLADKEKELFDREQEWLEKAQEYELRTGARNAWQTVRNGGWVAVDRLANGWTASIERAVDAYTRAWEETIREIMRPSSGRFRPGPSPTWPITEWVQCWGPTFGIPSPLGAQAASACGRLLVDYGTARENLNLLLSNAMLPEALREQIDHIHEELVRSTQTALPQIASMIRNGVGVPLPAEGSATFVARLWDSEVSFDEVEAEYRRDASGRSLPLYQPGLLRSMLEQDGLPVSGTPLGSATFDHDTADNFPPFYNARNLSILTLLDSNALNALTAAQGIRQTRYSDGRPAYPANRPVGEVLLGAIRSIDGNHQWMAVAPDLPRQAYHPLGSAPERITEDTCRRFGYPAGSAYPNNDLEFPRGDGDRIRCRDEEPPLQSYRNDPDRGTPLPWSRKGGFRLWQDATLRRELFNRVFMGPLSPGICSYLNEARRKYASNTAALLSAPNPEQHGCDTDFGPYPAINHRDNHSTALADPEPNSYLDSVRDAPRANRPAVDRRPEETRNPAAPDPGGRAAQSGVRADDPRRKAPAVRREPGSFTGPADELRRQPDAPQRDGEKLPPRIKVNNSVNVDKVTEKAEPERKEATQTGDGKEPPQRRR